MRSPFGNREAVAREIGGHFEPGLDKIVQPPKFGAVCKVLWPTDTDAHIAAIGKVETRTARRWLAGEYEPPVVVLLAVINKMFER